MKKRLMMVFGVALLALLTMNEDGCEQPQPKAASGVGQAVATVKTGSDGLTVEQRNVKQRLEEDNKPGAIKHLYVISPYSGQVIIYSTVRGKVTSGGKRLTPTSVAAITNEGSFMPTNLPNTNGINGNYKTAEVLQDDGTYGVSGDYVFWWDVRGVYHQHYLTGGQIVHISSQPLAVKSIIINIEALAGQ